MRYQLEKDEMDEIREILNIVSELKDEDVPDEIKNYSVGWHDTIENLARRASELKWKLQ